MAALFDLKLRAIRRDRAARSGVEPFLYRRALDDCIERLSLVPRRFERALLVGCLDPQSARELSSSVDHLEIRDPSPLLAEAAGGTQIDEESWRPEAGAFDLIVTIGTLDTLNALESALRAMFGALAADGLLLGALVGGDSLPRLRSALRAADAVDGVAVPHVHPRIEAAALAPLLEQAGFVRPVVDVDRACVRYGSLARLVADLRAMGATNVLAQRPRRGLSRRALAAAVECFAQSGEGERTTETFEILHFAAWTPPAPVAPG